MSKAPGAAVETIALNNESQLFADDYLIAERRSAHRRLNRPQRERTPFLVADRPWEGQGVVYGCVVRDEEGCWRLYYKGWQQDTPLNAAQYRAQHAWGKYPICLACSRDGHRFAKRPVTGAAVPDTNIVVDADLDDFTVLRDDRDPNPARRYKMLASKDNWWEGLTPATSPDGIRWTWGQDHAVAWFGDRCSYWYDPVQGRHVAWSRCAQMVPGRNIVHKETADFDQWSDERASHPRLVMQPDRGDHPDSQFYGGYAFWYRSLYFAYLEVYYIHHQRIDTQLCCSRDGRGWTRLCERDVFLPNGEHGEFDGYWSVPTFNPPFLEDGKLLIHYGGRPDPHSNTGFTHVPPGMGGAFALSTLREDGFVSLDATGAEGVVETKPLQLPAAWRTLEVNACPFNTRPGYLPMSFELEVKDATGAPVTTVALPPVTNAAQVWHALPLSAALPAVVRLRFRFRNARLYSFRFR